ncbi:hypothetical protein C8R48DRAFT_673640 [Suillus tomentosus]|nr:hypothetical protein C8R48DRAFT_673640 [Suillus tomentosus]
MSVGWEQAQEWWLPDHPGEVWDEVILKRCGIEQLVNLPGVGENYQEPGLNPYDARIKCDREKDGPLCYRQMGWIETFMNNPEVKATLGVNPQRKFESCNMAVNQVFMLQGDSMWNTPLLLTDMINDGVRLLIYAGNADEYDVQLHGAYANGYLFRHMVPYDQLEAALVDHGHSLAATGPLPTDNIPPHRVDADKGHHLALIVLGITYVLQGYQI